MDETSNGVNGGKKAGRICWTVSNTYCIDRSMGRFVEKREKCFSCEFFRLVKNEEGESFHLFKLAQGIKGTHRLHDTIAQMEHLISIHERLHSHFDLSETLREITSDARNTTGAQRSIVFLLKGDPPTLYGEFILKGKTKGISIPVDNSSAVGFAAANDDVVNLRDLHDESKSSAYPAFDYSFDRECNLETHSFLAVPVQDSSGRVIGVITAANARKGYFSADDEWFMRYMPPRLLSQLKSRNFSIRAFLSCGWLRSERPLRVFHTVSRILPRYFAAAPT